MTDATAATEITYDEAVKEFLTYIRDYRSFSGLTVRAYGTDMRMLRAFLEQRLGRVPSPTEITREMIVQFGVSLRKPAPLTLRRKYACISSFFGFLQDMGYAQAKPARRLPLPRVSEHVPVYLSEEMAQQLIAAADTPWTKAAVVLLLSTGIRRSEAVGVTLDDIDLEKRQLLIRGKGDKERVVPLTDQVVEAIQAYLPYRTKTQSRHLFVSAWKGHPIHGRCINRMLKIVIEKAGLEGQGITPRLVLHDRDALLVHDFDRTLTVADVEVVKTPFRAPDANAHAERWVRSVTEECLDHLILFGMSSLQRALGVYRDFYNNHRPHQGIGNRIPDRPATEGTRHDDADSIPEGYLAVECEQFLGGLLNSYYRKAA